MGEGCNGQVCQHRVDRVPPTASLPRTCPAALLPDALNCLNRSADLVQRPSVHEFSAQRQSQLTLAIAVDPSCSFVGSLSLHLV